MKKDKTIDIQRILKALASEPRLKVLNWLKEPEVHFRAQKVGDVRSDGVCGTRIAEKLECSLPTVSRHMGLLVDAGLVESVKIRQWTFYCRSEANIALFREMLSDTI